MKSSTLILVCIVALPLLACYQSVPAPPPLQPGSPVRTAAVCDNKGALKPVPFLVTPFNPAGNNVPTPDIHPPNNDVQTDLNAAFTAAGGFQGTLCGLDGIFIDPTGCKVPTDARAPYDPHTCSPNPNQQLQQLIADRSWGVRIYNTNPGAPNPGPKYIALSLGLWNNQNPTRPWPCPQPQNACAPLFQMYETGVIQAALQQLSPNALNDATQPDYDLVDQNSNTAAMTVLAALSHEFGHVLWWKTFVTNPGDLHTSNNITTFCNGIFYPANLWSAPVDLPQNRWIAFGQPRTVPPGATISVVQDHLNHGRFRDAGDQLDLLLSDKRWASVLAAFSPDEEFVEAFELHVLLNAKPHLQHLELRIFGNNSNAPYKHDRPFNLNPSSLLGEEVQCFP